jgi:hypothetical protein
LDSDDSEKVRRCAKRAKKAPAARRGDLHGVGAGRPRAAAPADSDDEDGTAASAVAGLVVVFTVRAMTWGDWRCEVKDAATT